MELRYIAAGANAAAIAVTALVYGLLGGLETVVGAAVAGLTVAAVLIAYGVAGGEPIEILLAGYSKSLSEFASRLLEDTNLLDTKPRIEWWMGVPMIVWGRRAHAPGLGLVDGSPYLAIPVKGLTDALGEETTGIEDVLKNLGVGRINVIREQGRYDIEVEGLPKIIAETTGLPVNPLLVAIMVAVGLESRREMKLSSYECRGNSCRFRLEEAETR